MTTLAYADRSAWYWNRWAQLVLGLIAMMAISSPQYVWTLFTGPLNQKLCTTLAEWALELPRPVGEEAVALAHSLAGNSATVGHADLSALARRLEHALEGSQTRQVSGEEAALYGDVAEEISPWPLGYDDANLRLIRPPRKPVRIDEGSPPAVPE